ncbi:autotransporter outer membrane beta-barrel domain-containing protein [Pseudomonas cavernicola]|uniref:Autotransporter outer membrane beta-barrel domain-containing protein n=1 Tax=Pseudomonas cavernicola TaxID=2320866 RepID=A0A418XN54_9PSED|nr:autotransporter domain-containing protein [Pseudomonas cavernicola]RJG13900.1 autotransporter outer membrane beta-barrel domain-containing protein [Pseudomonas cavernicola]
MSRWGDRLKGAYLAGDVPLEPYLRANLWHSFGGRDTVTFDGVDSLKTNHDSSTMDIGGGLVAKLATNVSLYLAADYSANIDSLDQEAVEGTLGVWVSW